MTGIDDVYEPPVNAEIELETVERAAEENAARVFACIAAKGFVTPND